MDLMNANRAILHANHAEVQLILIALHAFQIHQHLYEAIIDASVLAQTLVNTFTHNELKQPQITQIKGERIAPSVILLAKPVMELLLLIASLAILLQNTSTYMRGNAYPNATAVLI